MNEFSFRGRKLTADDDKVMRVALVDAEQSQSRGDLGIGAALYFPGGRIISEGDCVVTDRDPLAHAELLVLRKAIAQRKKLGEAVLYCTSEPCPMCAAAAAEAGVREVVFGAYNEANGFVSTGLVKLDMLPLSFKGGVLAEECVERLCHRLAETARVEPEGKDEPVCRSWR